MTSVELLLLAPFKTATVTFTVATQWCCQAMQMRFVIKLKVFSTEAVNDSFGDIVEIKMFHKSLVPWGQRQGATLDYLTAHCRALFEHLVFWYLAQRYLIRALKVRCTSYATSTPSNFCPQPVLEPGPAPYTHHTHFLSPLLSLSVTHTHTGLPVSSVFYIPYTQELMSCSQAP